VKRASFEVNSAGSKVCVCRPGNQDLHAGPCGLGRKHAGLLHAQCSAEKFYLRQGFVSQGEIYQEAGMDHVNMVRNL
jgi:hypothetical protein